VFYTFVQDYIITAFYH